MEEIFKNPKTISGLTVLHKIAIIQDKHIILKDVKEFLKNKYTSQIHKPLPNKHMHFYPITANKENDLAQIDLMGISNISAKNKNNLACRAYEDPSETYVNPPLQVPPIRWNWSHVLKPRLFRESVDTRIGHKFPVGKSTIKIKSSCG